MVKIYTASSWKNQLYPEVVRALRTAGHEVYDYREAISSEGKQLAFDWDQIDPNWESWTSEQFQRAMSHELAINAFASDKAGMDWADIGVLVLPCGKSSHMEAGYMVGRNKKVYILLDGGRPELTYKLSHNMFISIPELVKGIEQDGQ